MAAKPRLCALNEKGEKAFPELRGRVGEVVDDGMDHSPPIAKIRWLHAPDEIDEISPYWLRPMP